MKSTVISIIIFFFLIFKLNAQENTGNAKNVEVIKDFKNLYRYQNFYISGQPTLEELQWLKS